MMPPSASLTDPSANMIPSQSAHQLLAMHNPTETGSSGVQLQSQSPSSMMNVSKPSAQTGILPPPSSHMYIWQYGQKSPLKVDGLKFQSFIAI